MHLDLPGTLSPKGKRLRTQGTAEAVKFRDMRLQNLSGHRLQFCFSRAINDLFTTGLYRLLKTRSSEGYGL